MATEQTTSVEKPGIDAGGKPAPGPGITPGGSTGTSLMTVVRRIFGAREAVIALVVLVIIIGLSAATTSFLTVGNLMVVARQISLVAIIGVGMTFVIIMGGIDLSVGSVVSLAGVMAAASMVWWGMPVPVGIAVGLLVGMAAGFVNGFLHIKTGVAPFIITLGMMGFARGISMVITQGSTVSGLPSDYLPIGQGFLFTVAGFEGVPIPVVILLVLAVASHIFLSKTAMGRHVYFIGSNEDAARLSGINVNRLKVIIFTACGMLAALEAVIESARVGGGLPAAGVGYELSAIGSVIIGGASLNGGEGTVLGTVLGATLLGLITNGLILLGISSYWQQVFQGAIIVLAVTLDTLRHRRG